MIINRTILQPRNALNSLSTAFTTNLSRGSLSSSAASSNTISSRNTSLYASGSRPLSSRDRNCMLQSLSESRPTILASMFRWSAVGPAMEATLACLWMASSRGTHEIISINHGVCECLCGDLCICVLGAHGIHTTSPAASTMSSISCHRPPASAHL